MHKFLYIVLFILLFVSLPNLGKAQHKGISFQAVIKKPDGTYPNASGISVTAQILDPLTLCVLREEEHTGKNITNGYLNLVLGDSAASTPAVRNPSPILSIGQVLDNKSVRAGLKCVDQNNNIVLTGQSYTPSNLDRRVLRVRMNLQGEDIVADFNMRAVGFAVNSEMLNSKSDTDFINVNPFKGVEQNNLESIFQRFTQLDALLNNTNATGNILNAHITGNAATATTATSVTGTVAIVNGGTGAVSAAGARTNLGLGSLATLSPTGTADGTTYLRGDGTWQTVSVGGAVSSVAGRTGAVTLSSADVSGLGSLATKTISGTADNSTYLRGDGAWTALGDSAALNVGAGANTVAAGDDSRLVGAIQNEGSDVASNIVSFSAGLDANKPVSPVAGQMFVATDAQKIYRYSGAAWVTVAHGGNGFSGSLSGDVTGTQAATSVEKIKGQTVTATANTAGQVLRYVGSNNWTPGFVTMMDLRSSVSGTNQFTSSCLAGKTLTYNSVGDIMQCSDIAITKDQVSGLATVATSGSYTDLLNRPTLGTLASKSSVDLSGSEATGVIDDARLPASAKYWTAATAGIQYAGGRLGVGTSSPQASIDVVGALAISGSTVIDANGYPRLKLVTEEDDCTTIGIGTIAVDSAGNVLSCQN